jgi:hypothetical protein
LAAGQPGAPAVTAHEVAGDQWLQVQRYDEARQAYLVAAQAVGPTARVVLGLARVAARVGDATTACDQYRAFLPALPARDTDARVEVAEARQYLQDSRCQIAPAGRDGR